MDFFYEEQAVANVPEGSNEQEHDEKTDEVFHKLEDKVSSQYSKIEGQVNVQYNKTADILKNLVEEDKEKDCININLPIDDEYTEKANEVLSKLDNNLKLVEDKASDYWNKVSGASFWSNVSSGLNQRMEQISSQLNDATANATNLLNEATTSAVANISNYTATTLATSDEDTNVVKTSVAAASTRTEGELKELSTKKEIYLENKIELNSEFDVETKTDEIAKILKSDELLDDLMNEIVPTEIPYKDFWNIYFTRKQQILDMENKRKELLQNASKQQDNDEIIGWDDDDEEEENETTKVEDKAQEKKDDNDKKTQEVIPEDKKDVTPSPTTTAESRAESPVIIKKEDVIAEVAKDAVEEKAKKEEKPTPATEKNGNDDEDDDDDDWE